MPSHVSESKELQSGSNVHIEHTVALNILWRSVLWRLLWRSVALKKLVRPSALKSRQPYLNPGRNGKGFPKKISVGEFEKRASFQMHMTCFSNANAARRDTPRCRIETEGPERIICENDVLIRASISLIQSHYISCRRTFGVVRSKRTEPHCLSFPSKRCSCGNRVAFRA